MKALLVEHIAGDILYPTHYHLIRAFAGFFGDENAGLMQASSAFSRICKSHGVLESFIHPNSAVQSELSSLALWDYKIKPCESLFLVNGHGFMPLLQNAGTLGVNVFAFLFDDPHELSMSVQFSKYCKTVFTTEKNTVAVHGNAVYLPHAIIPDEVQRLIAMADAHAAKKAPDVLVCGSMYGDRVEWLNSMVGAFIRADLDVRVITYTPLEAYKSTLHPYWASRVSAKPIHWDVLQQLYRMSGCVLNIHRSATSSLSFSNMGVEASALNQAMFSVPAMGGIVLTDGSRQDEVDSLFDGDALCFPTPEAMADAAVDIAAKQAGIYSRARTAADRLQQRILSEHTWVKDRMPIVAQEMEKAGIAVDY